MAAAIWLLLSLTVAVTSTTKTELLTGRKEKGYLRCSGSGTSLYHTLPHRTEAGIIARETGIERGNDHVSGGSERGSKKVSL